MNKYIRIIEQQITTIKANIDRHKGTGCYDQNCLVWGHHLHAYERLLELVTAEAKKGRRQIA